MGGTERDTQEPLSSPASAKFGLALSGWLAGINSRPSLSCVHKDENQQIFSTPAEREPTDEYNKAVSVFHSLGTHIRGAERKRKEKDVPSHGKQNAETKAAYRDLGPRLIFLHHRRR